MKNETRRLMADRIDEWVDAERRVGRMFADATNGQVLVLQGLLLGLNHAEIARNLGVTPQGVSEMVVRMRDRFSRYPYV